MALPVPLSYAAMDAKLVSSLPLGEQWQYEPKWDGFRCLAFRDGWFHGSRTRRAEPVVNRPQRAVAAAGSHSCG
ncbi:MAG TPA: hypothetical protein VIM11_11315 [Tepidisphaeraceae bacterium]|jgi:ATP-dependent DNA ligase